ncbi:conserved hypothetical protein [Leishmania infantum JPCM5]|uniref:Uncharacterized protein n=3 Tax=Leishmania donovani species complex TaxID=38574 RepID=A4I5N5_LEIIN|nr:conserved hypothetical protein [Leishmania infantum JPCM5]XP_003862919.1 hypothetical protein, conserved [Leishmania donovani]CAC9514234.1 hypothetical_protein_-_conserved [Leishmania infantum]AYU81005.1 hypothetical protein LdCL_300026000 [Leishmania donovani]TPP45769.1 hypothetical protein CGC21_35800 [Leishmania donovani]CAM70105.1 conserved hypothetical protein [Leishmania infantum JPCM5]CBZ36228.1 hypothetical protein, conserved [Leishmania donovani]|eukprot:XP_001467054.1 conserved hypothetical protein [Leishmania infantum JPCM5]
MKFTHREIEDDRRKPVGSLFMHLIDRDSMPSRSHRNAAAQKMNTHSLPNTELSLYAQDAPQISSTPVRGRRHFPKQDRHVDCNKAEEVRPSRGVRRGATANGSIDHIGGDMTPRASTEVSMPRQRRYVPPPARSSTHRPFWLGDDEIVASARCRRGAGSAARSVSVGSQSFSRNSSTADHLTVGSLVPLPEKPVEKPVPPPLPIKPRRKGVRMFPGLRSRSADNARRGIRMVQPQPHWRSAADRQWDFLELGVGRRETPAPLYRNESHIDVGGPIIVREGPSTPIQRWRGGRRYGGTPVRRTFDIITGRPLVY